jgi:hypothetical protein
MGQEIAKKLDRRRVRPLDVVEREDDRGVGADSREQVPDRPVGAVALLLQLGRAPGSDTLEGGEHDRKVGGRIPRQGLEASGFHGVQPIVHGVDKTPNGSSASNSAALPESTRWTRSAARARSSRSNRLLPIPGSPATSRSAASPSS